ncbi:MAG: hypothetical protein DRN17_07855 [Thermoplasmata archaeon]|nr:MAG: hypothetical protein DRN17_07855 [Thermoplasmata archaeon]
MGVHPIEGYVVVCNVCGEKVVFYRDSEHKSSIEIDKAFDDWFNEQGWVLQEDGKTLCRHCFELKRYKGAFDILMEYWNSLPDEAKPEIDKMLKELGV